VKRSCPAEVPRQPYVSAAVIWRRRFSLVGVALAALADAVFIGAVCAQFRATPPDDKRSPSHRRNWSRLRRNRGSVGASLLARPVIYGKASGNAVSTIIEI